MTKGPDQSETPDPQNDQNTPRKEGFKIVNPVELLLQAHLRRRQRRLQKETGNKERKVNE